MAVYDVLPSTNLTDSDIRDTLRAGGGVVDFDSRSWYKPEANINPFSRIKPVPFAQLLTNNYPDWYKSKNFGMNIPTCSEPAPGSDLAEIEYVPPTGSESEPLRSSDFRGYNRFAKPPISLKIEYINPGKEYQAIRLTYTQRDADISLSELVKGPSFRIALVYKNANRISLITSPRLLADEDRSETYTLELSPSVSEDKGLMTDIYVVLTNYICVEQNDITWGKLGVSVAPNWKIYKEYHKQFSIVPIPIDPLTIDRIEIRKNSGSGRYWRVGARFYFSSKDGSNVTLNLSDYKLTFYSYFQSLQGQSSDQVDVNTMFGSQSTTFNDVVNVEDAGGTPRIIDLFFDPNHVENGYPKENVRVELIRKSDNKNVLTQYLDFKNL